MALLILAPFNEIADCDHDGDDPCSRCCPCDDCGRIRFDEADDDDRAYAIEEARQEARLQRWEASREEW